MSVNQSNFFFLTAIFTSKLNGKFCVYLLDVLILSLFRRGGGDLDSKGLSFESLYMFFSDSSTCNCGYFNKQVIIN